MHFVNDGLNPTHATCIRYLKGLALNYRNTIVAKEAFSQEPYKSIAWMVL